MRAGVSVFFSGGGRNAVGVTVTGGQPGAVRGCVRAGVSGCDREGVGGG